MSECFRFLVQYTEESILPEYAGTPSSIYPIGGKYAVLAYCSEEPYDEREYPYSVVPKCYGLMQNEYLGEMGLQRLENLPGFDLYGNGTIIGMLDTGIQYENAAFRNRDQTSRILAIWDQTIETEEDVLVLAEKQSETGLPKVPYGRVFSQNELTDLTAETGDDNGHGTALAGIAAGEETQEGYRGVAPDAALAVVRLREAPDNLKDYFRITTEEPCCSEADMMLAVQFLVQLADKEDKPLVILLALGTSYGGHTGSGLLDRYLADLSGRRGRCVVIAAGNEGNAGHHYHRLTLQQKNAGGSLKSADAYQRTGFEEVQLRVGDGENMAMELWSTTPDLFSISIVSPAGNFYRRVEPRSGRYEKEVLLLEGTEIVVLYEPVELRSQDALILIRFRRMTEGIWTIRVYPQRITSPQASFDIWMPIDAFLKQEAAFLKPDPDITVTGPGNTREATTYTAYDSLTGAIYPPSGRGYSRNGQVKPDLAAPGVELPGVRVLPGNDRSSIAKQPVRYVSVTGTSAAAACGAGIAALIMEWAIVRKNRPFLTGRETKAILINGAERDERGYPNPEWGYGKVNLFGAFDEL